MPLRLLHPANTNGVAIHLSESKAKESAMLELIERHTILYVLVAGIGPTRHIDKEISPSKKCRFYVWESPLKTFTVVGTLTDDLGSYFSSGCDYCLNKAILKAELELNSFVFLKEKTNYVFEIVKDDIQSINRYHKFSGDKSAVEFFETKKTGIVPDLDKKLFYYTKLPIPMIFKNLYQLPCIRVIHPDVQQLFFDIWKIEYLNPRLFKSEQVLPSFPHIIA